MLSWKYNEGQIIIINMQFDWEDVAQGCKNMFSKQMK